VPQVCKHRRKEDEVMGIFDILCQVVGILAGLATLTEKVSAYIERRKARTAKDPSASFQASDGSIDDCESNR